MGEPAPVLRWINSAGGPLILLSSEYLDAWFGCFHSGSDGLEAADDPLDIRTDYGRACAVKDYLGVVEVSDGEALVLGDEPLSTAWWPLSSAEGVLIRWVYGDDHAEIMQYLARVDDMNWTPSGITLRVSKHPLYLFDAASPGDEADDRLILLLDEGHYDVATGDLRPDPNTNLLLHRLSRR